MTDAPPPRGWKANELGVCPGIAKGKRVKVKLRCGVICGAEPVSKEAKAGWPADGMRWTLENHPFDVIAWDFV